MNGVQAGDKTILNNSDLHNLMKVVKKIRSDKTFRKFEYIMNGESQYLFIKRLIQLDEEYIFAYFIAPAVKEFVPDYEINANVIDLLTELSRTTYWYVDFTEGKEKYFSSSSLYGTNGEVVDATNTEYLHRLDEAAELNDEYALLVDVVRRNVESCSQGVLDSFRVKYPLVVNGEVAWVETMAKVASKDERGNTKLLVGVDVLLGENSPSDIQAELHKQVLDIGLNNAEIGVWVMTLKDGVKTFRYNAKLRELYRYDTHVVSMDSPLHQYDDIFIEAKKRVLNRYPEYNRFFEDDIVVFEKIMNGEIEEYRSILPFLDQSNKVVWLEIRASIASRNAEGVVTSVSGVAVDITSLFEIHTFENLFDKTRTKINIANKQAIEMMEILIWSIDYNEHPDGDYFYGNEQYIQKLGLTKNENGLVHINDYFNSIIESDEYSISFEDIGKYTARIKSGEIDSFSGLVLKHYNKKTGEVLYGSHSAQIAQRDKHGKLLLLSGFFIDVTNEIKEKKLRSELESSIGEIRKFNKLAVQAGQLMVFNINYLNENKGREIYANDYFIDRLQVPAKSNHFSYETYKDTVIFDEEGRRLFKNTDNMYLEVLNGERNSIENMLTKHRSIETGEEIYLQHNSHVEERRSDGRVVSIGGFLRDVTQDIINERKVKYLAEMDSLTDVYNRNKFEIFVKENDLSDYAIVMFDIDGLKLANDIYGHQVGDEVLIRFSNILKSVFSTGLIFRIGGDEFSVLIDHIEEQVLVDSIKTIEEAMETMTIEDSVQTGVSAGYEFVGDAPLEQAFMLAENQMYRKKLSSRSSRKSKTLDTLMVTLAEKTEETNEHCERIQCLAQEVFKKLGFTRGSELYDIGLAAKLHDIGKITIPLEILNKNGRLTKDEYTIVKKHSEAGYKIVFNIISSDDIAEGVLYHHERYDGKGYPYGLKGNDIPLYARIICVCDAFDAMISERPYSTSMSMESAIEELIKCKYTQFDPDVVDAFIVVLKEQDMKV